MVRGIRPRSGLVPLTAARHAAYVDLIVPSALGRHDPKSTRGVSTAGSIRCPLWGIGAAVLFTAILAALGQVSCLLRCSIQVTKYVSMTRPNADLGGGECREGGALAPLFAKLRSPRLMQTEPRNMRELDETMGNECTLAASIPLRATPGYGGQLATMMTTTTTTTVLTAAMTRETE